MRSAGEWQGAAAEGLTLDEVAGELGVTRQGAQQLAARGLREAREVARAV
jgi:DNA-directed RNA polymerase sigma subunit (sigma70/sigma32)